MFLIKTKFESSCNEPYCNLFDEIDRKINEISSRELDNIRFGFENDVDYDMFYDLQMYRRILKNLIYCSDCLCTINIDVVVSKIRRLTNSIC